MKSFIDKSIFADDIYRIYGHEINPFFLTLIFLRKTSPYNHYFEANVIFSRS